jgi:hypothetical protein
MRSSPLRLLEPQEHQLNRMCSSGAMGAATPKPFIGARVSRVGLAGSDGTFAHWAFHAAPRNNDFLSAIEHRGSNSLTTSNSNRL